MLVNGYCKILKYYLMVLVMQLDKFQEGDVLGGIATLIGSLSMFFIGYRQFNNWCI